MKYIEKVLSIIVAIARFVAGIKKKPEDCGCGIPDGDNDIRSHKGGNGGCSSRHRGDTDTLRQKDEKPNSLNMTGWALILAATIGLLVG